MLNTYTKLITMNVSDQITNYFDETFNILTLFNHYRHQSFTLFKQLCILQIQNIFMKAIY